jgi:hypothetical protein
MNYRQFKLENTFLTSVNSIAMQWLDKKGNRVTVWGNDIYGTPNCTTSYPMDTKPFIDIYKTQVGNASGLAGKVDRMRAEFAA